jgi:hypothetical protein
MNAVAPRDSIVATHPATKTARGDGLECGASAVRWCQHCKIHSPNAGLRSGDRSPAACSTHAANLHITRHYGYYSIASQTAASFSGIHRPWRRCGVYVREVTRRGPWRQTIGLQQGSRRRDSGGIHWQTIECVSSSQHPPTSEAATCASGVGSPCTEQGMEGLGQGRRTAAPPRARRGVQPAPLMTQASAPPSRTGRASYAPPAHVLLHLGHQCLPPTC